MPALWPAELPQMPIVRGGLRFSREQGFRESKMDDGTFKRMRRFGPIGRRETFMLVMTDAQRRRFDQFFSVDLAEGALPMTYTEHATGLPVSMHIERYPDWSCINAHETLGRRKYEASFTVLIFS